MVHHVSCSVCEYEDQMETIAEILESQEKHRGKYNRRHVLKFEVQE